MHLINVTRRLTRTVALTTVALTLATASVSAETDRAAPAPGPAPQFDVMLDDIPLPPGRSGRVFADVVQNSGAPIEDGRLAIGLPPGYALVEGDNPRILNQTNWTVSVPCSLNAAMATFTLTGTVDDQPVNEAFDRDITPGFVTLAPEAETTYWGYERTFAFGIESDRWSAVHLRSEGQSGGGQPDLWLDDDLCIGSPEQQSLGSGIDHEIVLVNGAMTGDVTHYAMATRPPGASFAPIGGYSLEYDRAIDLPLGTPLAIDFFSRENVETLQLPVQAGLFYQVTIVPGNLLFDDISVLGFHADRAHGSRANADFVIDQQGARRGETFIFQSPASGNAALIVFKDEGNANTSAVPYTVTVTEAFFADGFESQDTSAWSSTVP